MTWRVGLWHPVALAIAGWLHVLFVLVPRQPLAIILNDESTLDMVNVLFACPVDLHELEWLLGCFVNVECVANVLYLDASCSRMTECVVG